MNTEPVWSVVIPATRPQPLSRCIAALAAANYPRNAFEVIVVVDGLRPGMRESLASVRCDLSLRIEWQEQAGPAAARNRGAQLARGRYLAFTDDDCAPEADWLPYLESVLSARSEAVAGGLVINALDRNLFSAASQFLVDVCYAAYNEQTQDARLFASNNLGISRDMFMRLGGFDARYPFAAAEDRDLCERARVAGGQLCYEPRARVQHFHALTARSFCRQHYRYGRGAARYLAGRQRQAGADLAAALRFQAAMPRRVWQLSRAYGAQRRGGLLALMPLWTICNAAGFALESVQQSLKYKR